MAINNTYKSARLLQSRRYTHDSFTDSQEAFTSTLDINANEVYVDQSLIPYSNLPYSGSGQSGSIYSVNGQAVMKYYYRAPMTRSNLVSGSANEVWFLLSPSGSAAGIGAQLIDPNQQGNFISPKYATSSLANANAEDATPGYGVKVFVSTNATTPAAGDQVSVNNYSFDYKTGVLQFATNALSATTSQYVYITTYQYVGRLLSDNITNVSSSISALSASVGSGGSIGSRVDQLSAATASVNAFTSSQQAKDLTLASYTSSMNSFSASITASVVALQGTGGTQGLGQGNQVTFAKVTTTGDVVVGGDLVVQGNTVTLNTAQLVVEDKLISLASGSTNAATANGAGIEVLGANATFTYDSTPNAWTANIPISASAVTASVNVPGFGSSKRVAFRATTGNLDFVAAPTTSGDLVQWDGTNFVMNNTIDGGTF
jgi:hypothetical protein